MQAVDQMKPKKLTPRQKLVRDIFKRWEFYAFMIPGILTIILFAYVPMYGLLGAWKNMTLGKTVATADWVGWANFTRFFESGWFLPTVKNTVFIAITNTIIQWPFPIIFALMLHNCTSLGLKKFAQTTTYIPHLLSTVIVISVLNIFFNGSTGVVNIVAKLLGGEAINYFGAEKYVAPLYIGSNMWQHLGYNAIIYLAALSSVDPSIVEAATIDGCSKLRRIWHIDLPTIKPTIVTLLIMQVGQVFAMGPEKMYLMQTPLNLGASEVIATYVYKVGILEAQFGFGTAVGMLTTVINFIVLVSVNWISKKLTETSLF